MKLPLKYLDVLVSMDHFPCNSHSNAIFFFSADSRNFLVFSFLVFWIRQVCALWPTHEPSSQSYSVSRIPWVYSLDVLCFGTLSKWELFFWLYLFHDTVPLRISKVNEHKVYCGLFYNKRTSSVHLVYNNFGCVNNSPFLIF